MHPKGSRTTMNNVYRNVSSKDLKGVNIKFDNKDNRTNPNLQSGLKQVEDLSEESLTEEQESSASQIPP